MKSPLSFITASATAKSLNIVGDQWSYLILRDMFLGLHRFEELLRSTGASRGTLTDRLKSLDDNGVLHRRQVNQSRRHEYRLTEKGLAIYPLAVAAWMWEVKWANSEASPLPRVLIHKTCRSIMQPVFSCHGCREPVQASDVSYMVNESALSEHIALPKQRRQGRKSANQPDPDRPLFRVIDAVSDRWTSLILAGAFMGADRFDTFQHKLHIATNILTSRLKKLVQNKLLERIQYQEHPARYSYKLTPKAYDLYPLVIALHQWGHQWLENSDETTIELNHQCGHRPFAVDLVCDCCGQEIHRGDVIFQLPAGKSWAEKLNLSEGAPISETETA
ncbi:helix-turn-helix transcriptional regulator [Sansalvadorimonas sp. 2012CJ34-2]|uniref:Helix-turn-helix transcriptional regulator n=1 Tax=Parendozoicomonas callyspongiae TaxID=2942213 RepID=A0ABT0PKM4_9GAMM|nr:helix-turn-helix domain-containing protein [Sansalvadorimonas sp. 2012CJ34-2]MCL6271924.1 helix-turn-helix transcriptional regulator [Sansalvadorimonas sp. 2012CJ34-2]